MKEEINEIDWQAALDGTRPVTTRDGKKVTLYCVDAPGEEPIHGRFEGSDGPTSWFKGGKYFCMGENNLDLIQPPPAPKPFKRKFWVNIYPDCAVGAYDTKELANAWAEPARIACVRVVVEGHEGNGL